MILVDGVRLQKTGHRWRYVECPHVEMLRGEVFVVAGVERKFRTVSQALKALAGSSAATKT